jgi:hypothetical protein
LAFGKQLLQNGQRPSGGKTRCWGDGCMRQTVRPMVRIVSGKAETKISSYD